MEQSLLHTLTEKAAKPQPISAYASKYSNLLHTLLLLLKQLLLFKMVELLSKAVSEYPYTANLSEQVMLY